MVYVKPPSWNPRPIPVEPGQMFLRALDIETGKRVASAANRNGG
jgi:hypothetical protein